MVPLKYLSNFWRTLEMLLINCEIDIILTWSANCVIVSTAVANQGTTFAITDTKVYVPVVTLSTQDIMKLLGLLKSGFERIINSNKCQLKAAIQAQNQYWLYVLVMSRTRFRVNPHSIVAWMSRNSLLEAGAKSEGEVTATGLEPRTT